MRKANKNIISLCVILIITISITTTSAFALSPPRMKAGIAAAITAINIAMTSATAPIQEMIDYIGDPLNVVYSYSEAFNDRPQIQIWEDYIEIDGQEYTDIWISHDAAEKFRVNAFDFRSAYNIASESNGTYADGMGYFDGIPMFRTSGNLVRSQMYTLSGSGINQVGNTAIEIRQSGNYRAPYVTFSNGTTSSGGYLVPQYKCQAQATTVSSTMQSGNIRFYDPYYPGYQITVNVPGQLIQNTPFDFDYVSGTIPADTVLPSDDGMMIRVPSNPDLHDFIVDNPDFAQPNGITIDPDIDPNIYLTVDDLFDIIAPIIPIINNNLGDITFEENHPQQPVPVPDTLLPDTWFSQLREQFQNVINSIQSIPSEIQTIIQPIIQAIQTIPQSISNLGDKILQDIEEGPIRIFDKVLDILKSLFLPILTRLKGFLGIWHYVVTWIGNIAAPLTWTLSMINGTSPVILSPVYALIAGGIVIAVYKRFGR